MSSGNGGGGVRCLDGHYEPTMTNPKAPFTAALTSSSFRSVPKAKRLLNSLSIAWRAWHPREERERQEGLRLASFVPGLSPVSRGPRPLNAPTDLPLHANLRALSQVSCDPGSFLQGQLGNCDF